MEVWYLIELYLVIFHPCCYMLMMTLIQLKISICSILWVYLSHTYCDKTQNQESVRTYLRLCF